MKTIKQIVINFVPNEFIKIRKGFTGADWYLDSEGALQVRIAEEAGSMQEQACLAMHEVAEALMCFHRGVTVEQVDAFDAEYQRTHAVDLNAGDEPQAPYRVEHGFATAIERVMAGVLEVDWKSYDERLSKL